MEYQHRDFPKMVYFEDGSNKVVRDQDELSKAQGEGATDAPVAVETEDKAAAATVTTRPEQTVRQLAGLDPADQGEAVAQQRKERAEASMRAAAGKPLVDTTLGRDIATKGPARGADFSNDAAESERMRAAKKAQDKLR